MRTEVAYAKDHARQSNDAQAVFISSLSEEELAIWNSVVKRRKAEFIRVFVKNGILSKDQGHMMMELFKQNENLEILAALKILGDSMRTAAGNTANQVKKMIGIDQGEQKKMNNPENKSRTEQEKAPSARRNSRQIANLTKESVQLSRKIKKIVFEETLRLLSEMLPPGVDARSFIAKPTAPVSDLDDATLRDYFENVCLHGVEDKFCREIHAEIEAREEDLDV